MEQLQEKTKISNKELNKIYKDAFDSAFDFKMCPPEYYTHKELKHDIIEAIKQGIDDFKKN